MKAPMKRSFSRAFLVIFIFRNTCTKVPLTGLKQLSLVNESEVMSLSLNQYDQLTISTLPY